MHKPFSTRLLIAIIAALSVGASLPTQAEKISVGRQAAAADGLERPRTGLSMQNVESRFGSPIAMRGPVGDPPITIWDYPQYTVYFEYNHVIHTVIKPR